MKIGASTLAGIEGKLENTLEFIENLGLDYAEIVHQYPDDKFDVETLESFNLKYSGSTVTLTISTGSGTVNRVFGLT